MTVDKAKCPDCGTYLKGEEIEELVVESGGIAPMGAGKSKGETMYVCPVCDVILG